MRKLVASCSAVLIAAAALAACGSNGSSKANSPSATTNAGGSSSPSDTDLSELVANADKQKFKLTYTDGSGATQTYEQDGNGNSVSGTDDSLTFDTKTSIVNCDKTSGSYQCTETPASQRQRGAAPSRASCTALLVTAQRARRTLREPVVEDDRRAATRRASRSRSATSCGIGTRKGRATRAASTSTPARRSRSRVDDNGQEGRRACS